MCFYLSFIPQIPFDYFNENDDKSKKGVRYWLKKTEEAQANEILPELVGRSAQHTVVLVEVALSTAGETFIGLYIPTYKKIRQAF